MSRGASNVMKEGMETVKSECERKSQIYYDYHPGRPECPAKPMRKVDWLIFGILCAVMVAAIVVSGTVMMGWYYP